MPLMRHDDALAYTEQEAPFHRPVLQGGREEAQTAGGGGAAGEFGEGITGLWGIARASHLVRLTGKGYDGGDKNWLDVAVNLRKAQNIWTRMTRILVREGADPRISGLFFKAAIQAVLLFGLEMWVLTPCMKQALGSFQHRVAQRITGRQPRRPREGGWEYPLL